MDWQAWLTLGVTAAVFLALVFSEVSAAVVLTGGVVVLMAAGVLNVQQALAGLSNDGMVTVAVLFVVGAGIRETGGIDWLAGLVLGRPKTATGAVARLAFPTAAISGFMNNTPLVAMLIPVVSDWAKKNRIAPSKLMIPLSYAAILGGLCTLIGTSTNVIVSGQLTKRLGEAHALGMFDITWVGLPCCIVGCVFLVVASRWLLPDRRAALSQLEDPRQYTVELLVERDSALVGKTIEEAGLRHLPGMFLAEIDREGQVLAAVSPSERLRGDDRLLFVGVVESVVDLQRIRGLKPATDQVFKLTAPRSARCLMEAVVSNTSPLVGKTIRDARFRSNYNAVVLAVARNGERLRQKIGDIVVRPGDTLLVEGQPAFVDQHRNSRDFFLVSQLEDSTPPSYERAPIALAILVAMVVVAAAGWMHLLTVALLAAAAMLLMQCTTVASARRSLDTEVLLSIAAASGLGTALEATGAARTLAEGLIGLAGGHPWATLAVLYLVTLVVTELLSNNAAAILMFPFALASAQDLGISYTPFVMAVMIAASSGFATPIGYQTNLMVYGPGGYRFSDFVRIGVPLDIVIAVVALALLPWAYPFVPYDWTK